MPKEVGNREQRHTHYHYPLSPLPLLLVDLCLQTQIRQNVCCVGFGVDAVVNFGDVACAVDDEGDALGVAAAFYVEGFGDGAVCVYDEGEGEAEFFFEGFVGGFVVHADAENNNIFALIFAVGVAEAASLLRAAGSVVFGIEVDDDGFARKV